MSIKLKYSSYIFSYLFVCLLLFDSYCLSFSYVHRHTHALDSPRCTERALHVCVCVCIYMYFIWLTVENGHIRALASLASPAVILIVSFCNCLQCFFIYLQTKKKNTKNEIVSGVHVRALWFFSFSFTYVWYVYFVIDCQSHAHIYNCCWF